MSLRSTKGFALPAILMVGMFVGIGMLVAIPLLKRTSAVAFDAERQFEAQMLATNVRELAKYLLLYEKVIYTGKAGTPDPLTIDDDVVRLWGQGMSDDGPGATNLRSACGGYTLGARYIGKHIIDGKQVFCPVYLRDQLLSGMMLEQTLLDQWASVSPNVLTRTLRPEHPIARDGIYYLDLDFTKALLPGPNKLFVFDQRQNLVAEVADKNSRNLQAKVTITFSSDSSGYRAVAAERYVSLRSVVTFDSQGGARNFVEDTETVMMALSSPKSFALFFPYPAGGGRELSQSVRSTKPSSVRIHGRTYFNGDLDLPGADDDMETALNNLPFFDDTVVLSGTFTPKIPGPKHLATLRSHFRKGIVTNFSASRFVLDGTCAPGSTTAVDNQSGIGCKPPVPVDGEVLCPNGAPKDLITQYVIDLSSPQDHCWNATVPVTGGRIGWQSNPDNLAVDERGCVATDGTWLPAVDPLSRHLSVAMTPIHGGFCEIVVGAAAHSAVVMTPVRSLKVTGDATEIYGTVFGGLVDLGGNSVDFYSLSALTPTRPDVSDQESLDHLNEEAAKAYEGISKSMLNLPIVYSSKEGLR